MKKRDRERKYKSLLEKDYLKAIISDLALRLDFTQDSWMCQTIVDKVAPKLVKIRIAVPPALLHSEGGGACKFANFLLLMVNDRT